VWLPKTCCKPSPVQNLVPDQCQQFWMVFCPWRWYDMNVQVVIKEVWASPLRRYYRNSKVGHQGSVSLPLEMVWYECESWSPRKEWAWRVLKLLVYNELCTAICTRLKTRHTAPKISSGFHIIGKGAVEENILLSLHQSPDQCWPVIEFWPHYQLDYQVAYW